MSFSYYRGFNYYMYMCDKRPDNKMSSSMSYVETIITLVILSAQLGSTISQVLIQTSAGPINGIVKELDGVKYRTFLGVPYAEQPDGFRPPTPKSSRSSTLQATKYGPSCPQNSDQFDEHYLNRIPDSAKKISEDCLTLNIFAPDDLNPADDETFAVMVWFYGGDFDVGHSAAYDGAALTTRGRVIVVTLNYRLGPFGFLSTLDQYSTGNYGLLDQQLALKWIQKDITKFGGDPKRVTLFGVGTGGICAALHLFAPRSQQLFHRVIASGAVTTPWNLNDGYREPSRLAKEFGSIAECPSDDSAELIACLRVMNQTNLMRAWQKVDKQPWRTTWGPVVDGAFLPAPSIYTGTAEDKYMVMDRDILIGVSTHEATPMQISKLDGIDDVTSGLSKRQWDTFLKSFLADFEGHRTIVSSAVSQLYTDWHMYGNDSARLQQALDMITDTQSVIKTYDFLTSWTSGKTSSNVFMYVFDHKTESRGRGRGGMLIGDLVKETPYVWGDPFRTVAVANFTEAEKKLSDSMIVFWTNFAKSGDPSKNPDQPEAAHAISNLPKWPKYKPAKTYLNIKLNQNTEELAPKQGYRWQYVYFWTETLPILIEQSTCSQEVADNICKIGANEGWNLTPKEAVVLLNILLVLCVALFCLVLMVCAAACGYRDAVKIAKYGSTKGKWAYLSKNGSNRDRTATWKINDGFEIDLEDKGNKFL